MNKIFLKNLPLIVIVGPTASGKTSEAIKLAKNIGGEIICADSRTVYKYMDVGTAKPDNVEQAQIQHWGLDLIEPNERFTVADFQKYANTKIDEIRSRGKIPMLVGGTGLYVDAVVYDYDFNSTTLNLEKRKDFESKSLDQLYKYCKDNNIDLPENSKNKRHVVNKICRNGEKRKQNVLPENTIIVGITTDRDILKNRIRQRAYKMFEQALLKETQFLLERYDNSSEALTGNVYPVVKKYLNYSITLEECIEEFCRLDMKLVKRQLTWFKRNKDIAWYEKDELYKKCRQKLI